MAEGTPKKPGHDDVPEKQEVDLDKLPLLPPGSAVPPDGDDGPIPVRGTGSDNPVYQVGGVGRDDDPTRIRDDDIEDIGTDSPTEYEHGAQSGILTPGTKAGGPPGGLHFLAGEGPLGIGLPWWVGGIVVAIGAAVLVGLLLSGGSDDLDSPVDTGANLEWDWHEDPAGDTGLCVSPDAMVPDPEADILRTGVRPINGGYEVRVETAGSPARAWSNDYSFAVTIEVGPAVPPIVLMAEMHDGEELKGSLTPDNEWEQAILEVEDTAVLFTVTGLDEMEMLDIRVGAAHTVEVGGDPVCDTMQFQVSAQY